MADRTESEAAAAVLDAAAVRRLARFPALIEALRAGFAGDVVVPERHVHPTGDGTVMMLMPAWQPGGASGVKILTVDSARRPSIAGAYLLLDGRGGPLALLDGAMLTARRTAATSALAADMLANPDASTLLVLGTGALAAHMVEAHAAVRPIRRVMCWGRDSAQAARVAADAKALGLAAEVVDGVASAVAQADIVCAVTASTSALIPGEALRPGTHVDLVGSYRPDMREADGEALRRSRVFVDNRAGAMHEAGDILQAISEGAIAEGDVLGDLAGLCRGEVQGRIRPSDITLFKAVGSGLADLVAAEHVHAAHRQGL